MSDTTTVVMKREKRQGKFSWSSKRSVCCRRELLEMSLVPVTSQGRFFLLRDAAWFGELSQGIRLPPALCCPASVGALTIPWLDDVHPPHLDQHLGV